MKQHFCDGETGVLARSGAARRADGGDARPSIDRGDPYTIQSIYPLALMRKAAVLYNPRSGSGQERRRKDIEAVLAVFRKAGVEVLDEPTGGASESAEQARRAVKNGCDTVFACGGDGTIHNILQGLAGSSAALGVIPFGTANALAHDLGLPLSPVAAARAASVAEHRRVAAGRVEYVDLNGTTQSRFFLIALGIGVDAHLFYKLNTSFKKRMGMLSYYAKATHLWLTHPMENFSVEFEDAGGKHLCNDVSQLLAVRIRNFGGVLRELAPGATLDRKDLRLVNFRTRSRLTYLRYICRGLLGTKWTGKGIELVSCNSVECRALGDSRIFVEADGELLGALPARISIVPDAVTLLTPKH